MIGPEQIRQLARQYVSAVTAIRRHLHAHPELSFEEYTTSAYVCERLEEYGIAYQTGFVKTGIIAVIEGKNPERKTIALRADMDALPIHEQNDVPYRSVNEGVMHACGHDVHTACVLGAGRILYELRHEWEGRIVLLFQPGEEKLPGGAKLMIAEGALQRYPVSAILAQHVFPSMEAGNLGFRPGMYMASSDELYITVKGKGGHAALPSSYLNPVMMTAELLLYLQRRFAELKPENDPAVLAFGKITGDGATNVIPGEVKLEGTLRTLDEQLREKIHAMLLQEAPAFCRSLGGDADMTVLKGYPVLYNNEALTQLCTRAAEEYLGPAQVHPLDLRMTAEDFAYYSQVLPACFYRLGTGNAARGITASVHTSTFDIDESAIETGMGAMAWMAVNMLEE